MRTLNEAKVKVTLNVNTYNTYTTMYAFKLIEPNVHPD